MRHSQLFHSLSSPTAFYLNLDDPCILYAGTLLQSVMGIAQSDHIIQNRWDYVRQAQGGYVIVRDKSGREGAEYSIEAGPESLSSEQLAIYDLRKMSPHQVVSVYGSQFSNQSGGFCSGNHSFRVITENLCVRFSENFLLNIEEVTYVLLEAVKGFSYLYSKVGCFGIKSSMIGLNAEGELKVWMNTNLGENSPQFPKGSIITVGDGTTTRINQEQHYMIKQIFIVVEGHTDKRFFESQLKSIAQNSTSFVHLQELLNGIKIKFKIPTILRIDFSKKGFKLT